MKRQVASVVILAAIATCWVSVAGAHAQDKAKPAPEEQTGLKVGSPAPAFTLKDQSGKERTLDDLLAKGKVALVFYRSANW